MVAILFNAGDHVPVIPLLDVVGNADKLPPLHIAATCVKVGVTFAFTVPDAATFCVVPPVDATVILPPGVPVAELLSLTNIGVLAMVPPVGVKLSELL